MGKGAVVAGEAVVITKARPCWRILYSTNSVERNK
jgi:hypothetical protein